MEFEALYRTYYPIIQHYCNNILYANHVIGHNELADDYTAEVFIAAWHRWATFKSEPNLKRFLYRGVKYKAFNKLEEIKRRMKDHKDILFLSTEGETPDYLAINSEVIGFIFTELQKLPPRCVPIMELFFKGWSSARIAAYLHITRKTVLNQKLESISKLKKSIILKFGYL